MQCRFGKLEDIPQLTELLRQLFSIESDFQFDGEKHKKAFEMLIASSTSQIFVAEVSGKVIAMVSLQVLISTSVGGYSGLIEDFIVDEKYRSQTIGQQLLSYLENWANENHVLRLQLLADKDNNKAHKFYYSNRFQETNMFAIKKLI